MKIVIFGASGGVGRHLIEQTLAEGHAVTAFVRDRTKISDFGDRVRMVEGDVTDADAVLKAVENQDAVVCALGAPLQNADRVRTQGTRRIIDAMKQTGVSQFVCLSSMGSGDSRAIIPFHYRALIVPLFMRRLFRDHEDQEAIVQESGLDWTIVRPGNFTDGAHTGDYLHGLTADARRNRLKFRISRADVTDFIVQQLAKPFYMRSAAWLSY